MCKANQTPAAIEGSELSVTGQDIKTHGPPKKLGDSGEIVFQLTVYKRGESAILKENSSKRSRFREYSFLDKSSEISAPLLWGFSSNPLGIDDIEVGGRGRTSSQPGQSATIVGTCFMEIIKGWRGNSLLTHPKETLLR